MTPASTSATSVAAGPTGAAGSVNVTTVGAHIVAQALGATKDAARLAARRGSSRRTSFSSPLASSGAGGGGGGAAAAASDVELAAV